MNKINRTYEFSKMYYDWVCKCLTEDEKFDTDSQGGRGYCCECGYYTWVSYKCVDKNFLIES